MRRRRDDYAAGFAHPIWTAWVEEAFDADDLPLPAGAPEFLECRHAYARARWLGPGRGWVDPVAEKEGAILGIAAGLSSQQEEIEENVGRDLEEILDEQAEARQLYAERGMDYPDFGAMKPSVKSGADEMGNTKKQAVA
jgi:capsid protein